MRNLKKVLALAVASVMLMGMMVMGTSAAYPDVAVSNDNIEAIEVLKLVGVMSGDDKGNFNPDKTVTRNEMAVIMVNLMDLKLNGSHPFTDVPTWADKYVAACYTNGVVSGTSATTYGGDEQLTAAQAALMVMKTLGYFEFQGEFGSDWKLATVKQATKLDLFDKVEASVDAPLTRAEAAQLVFNALDEVKVIAEEIGGMKVEGNGIAVSQAATYEYTPVGVLQDELFGAGNLTEGTSSDDLGRTTTVWTYVDADGETHTAEWADEATYTLVVNENATYANKAAFMTDIKDATENDDLTLAHYNLVYLNGDQATGWNSGLTPVVLYTGDIIEIYADTKTDVISKVIIKTYVTGVIDEVDTEVSEADAKNDITAYVTVEGVALDNKTIAGYNAATYTEDTRIAYIYNGVEIIDSFIPEIVKGVNFTAIAGDDTYAKAGATKYTAVGTTDFSGASVTTKDDTYTYDLYVDANGYVLYIDEVDAPAATLDDVYYVLNAFYKSGAENEYGVMGGNTGYVQVVDLNGVISNVQVEYTEEASPSVPSDYNTTALALVGQLVTFDEVDDEDYMAASLYEFNDDPMTPAVVEGDEKWGLETSPITQEVKTTSKRLGGYYLTKDTKYIMITTLDTDGSTPLALGKIKTTVKTGPIAYTLTNAVVIYNEEGTNNTAAYVFVKDADATSTSYEDKLYVKSSDAAKYEATEDGNVFTVYNVKGEKVEILVDAGTTSLTAGFNTYEINSDGEYALSPAGDKALPGSATEWTDSWTGATLGRYFYSFYEGNLSIGSGGKLLDIPADKAVIVDLHSTTAAGNYTKALTSLEQIETLKYGTNPKLGTVKLDLDIGEDGAVIIFIVDADAI